MLSASTLKLLACGFMLIDHVGVRLFPDIEMLRILGRLAFPIFAWFIGEGCRYTGKRLKHFLSVFILGCICELVYIIYMGGWYGNILLTFSLSILMIYLMQWLREKLCRIGAVTGTVTAISALILSFALMYYVNFDYGFSGMLLPLAVAWPGDRKGEAPGLKPAVPGLKIRLLLFSFLIMLTALESGNSLQLYALLSVPLLALYSGKGGNKKLKYFFYIFYPVHLLLIEAAAMLMI